MSKDGTLAGLLDLSGKVALVTGGSRGLGLQIASALGEYGASLALVARKQAELDAAVEQLSAKGITAAGFAADLGSPHLDADTRRMLVEAFGTPDPARFTQAVEHRDRALLRRLQALDADQHDTGAAPAA